MTQNEKELLDNLYDYFFGKFDAYMASQYFHVQTSKLVKAGDISSAVIKDYKEILSINIDPTIPEVTKKVKIIKVMRLFNERDRIAEEAEKSRSQSRPSYRSSC